MDNKNAKFWLPKNRYYELKYYCLQYHYWQKLVNDKNANNTLQDRAKIAIYLVQNAIMCINCGFNSDILLDCVTEGLSYEKLVERYNNDLPDKKSFYDAYRKFFYFLSKSKGI